MSTGKHRAEAFWTQPSAWLPKKASAPVTSWTNMWFPETLTRLKKSKSCFQRSLVTAKWFRYLGTFRGWPLEVQLSVEMSRWWWISQREIPAAQILQESQCSCEIHVLQQNPYSSAPGQTGLKQQQLSLITMTKVGNVEIPNETGTMQWSGHIRMANLLHVHKTINTEILSSWRHQKITTHNAELAHKTQKKNRTFT